MITVVGPRPERGDGVLEGLELLAGVINGLHDLLVSVTRSLGWRLSDKELHFIVFGVTGIMIFILADIVFKRLAGWSVSIISFIYTFTVLLVLVFGLEIEQGLTGSGNVEFTDIVAGLWGFLFLFGVLVLVKVLIYGIKKLFQ